MAFTKTTWVDATTLISAAQLNRIEQGVYDAHTGLGSVPTVSSLPGSPIDGQECFYVADATNGVVWHLKYRSADASAYKWNYVGGAALLATTGSNSGFGGARETYNSTTYGDMTTVGPTITLPLAGDYDIDSQAEVEATGNTHAHIRPWTTGEATNLTWNNAVDSLGFYAGLNGRSVILGHARRTGLASGNAIKLQYAVSNNGTAVSFWNRRIRAIPVRVG